MSEYPHHKPRPRRWPNIAALLVAIALACVIWWIYIITPWAETQTRVQADHPIWWGTLPGIDVGLDARRPRIQVQGYVEGWIAPHWSDEVWVLLRIPGAPARPVPPEWVTAAGGGTEMGYYEDQA